MGRSTDSSKKLNQKWSLKNRETSHAKKSYSSLKDDVCPYDDNEYFSAYIINDPLVLNTHNSPIQKSHVIVVPLVRNDYSLLFIIGPKVGCIMGAQSYEIERKNLYRAE